MRGKTYEEADEALTTLAKNAPDNQETRDAIDAIMKLLYRYRDAIDTLHNINAKIFNFTEK